MTTPQNPYGPQAQPAQPYFPSHRTGPQGSYPRHAAPAPQASWNPGPQQPYQASMSTGYPQHGGYAPQNPAQGYAPQSPAQGYGAYAGQGSAAYSRQDVSAPAGLPQQPAAAGVPSQRSGEQPLPQYPAGGGQPPRPPRNGLGTTALVLGILAVLFAMIPIVGMIAWPLSILGLIFGIVGVVRTRSGKADNKGVAISGTVLSAIGLILCIVWVAAFSNAVATAPVPSTGSVPAASTPASGQSSAATTGKPGDTLTAGDMQVTAAPLQSKSEQYVGPMKCADVTYRNTGTVQASYNMFDWKLQNPAGAITDPSISGDNTLSSGELAPGGTTSGQVCFDAKSGQSGAYTLTYSGGLFGGDKLSWTN